MYPMLLKSVCFAWFCLFIVTSAEESFDLVHDVKSSRLVLSTLDGSLICVDSSTGKVKWKIKEEPAMKMPTIRQTPYVPFFLPDPTDGSLYVYGDSEAEPIKKLPFTIPHLVSSSPCRSSDGIMYSGKKIDSWFSINPVTGAKKKLINFENGELSTCPREGPESVFIGRSEYSIIMIDPMKRDQVWNATFFDYAASSMDENVQLSYDAKHFTSSSSGRLLTISLSSGEYQWELNVDSPIIGMYLLQQRGLLSVPFTSIAESTLNTLIEDINSRKNSGLSLEFKPNDLQFLPTLYVGENIHGLYALPSLVDKHTATIELSRKGPLLLEGPSSGSPNAKTNIPAATKQPAIIILGHYKVPDYSQTHLQIIGNNSTKSSVAVQTEDESSYVVKTVSVKDVYGELLKGNITLSNLSKLIWECWHIVRVTVLKDEYSEIKAIMLIVVIFVGILSWRLHRQIQDIQQMSQGSRQKDSSHSSNIQSGSIRESIECEPGVIQVGKIKLFTDQVLGKGCEGTFVFRGEFDSRAIAVKRVLPECYTFADREVDLLRESDAHPNVVRYFCTEQDKQFRYIALELCAATLQDYVLGTYKTNKITNVQILQQATQGLAHLHSLNIVHRDIKPHNVLLSIETLKGQVRAMISDFGLCKKLPNGSVSFSKRSGVTGTDGWIAPEMLNGESRPTYAIDIFSLGCVFYYVLTNGKHPFGDTLHRQANILSGLSDLRELTNRDQQAKNLIDRMIAFSPSDRPPANAVLKHPWFWNQAKILAFFQDVSDRVEKECDDSFVLLRLEEDCGVFTGDWRTHIDTEVAEDLRKYRNYRGDSIRDLLRALRNKKHHYRELSKQAQKSLGEIPTDFVHYWTSRFPLLLLHSWLSLQTVKREPIFKQYYNSVYNFPRLPQIHTAVKIAQLEGFNLRRPSLDWRVKDSDLNWRERRPSDSQNLELDLRNKDLYQNSWFMQWFNSDFWDDNAFIKWREEEFYKSFAINSESFQPELPTRFMCDRLRFEKRALDDESKKNAVYSRKKSSSPKKYYRRPKKTVDKAAY